ncbi:MAG: hypothetical protein AAF403_03545 [Pseudomonadota bacterium]
MNIDRQSLANEIGQLASDHHYLRAYKKMDIYLQHWPNCEWGLHQKALFLYHQGKHSESLTLAKKLFDNDPNNNKLQILIATLHHEMEMDSDNYIAKLESAIKNNPNDLDALRNYGSSIWKTDRDKGYKALMQALTIDPEDYASINNFTMMFTDENKKDHARAFGAMGLAQKDRIGCKTFMRWKDALNLKLQPPNPNQGTRKVVSMCLWGTNPSYWQGAVRSANEMEEYYPGWELQIIYDETLPVFAVEELIECGAHMVPATKNQKRLFGGLWRFYASHDETIGHFVCRDADSRFSKRESEDVKDWMESGKLFHIIRDDIWHCDIMLAGLWGGLGGRLPNLEPSALQLYGESIRKWDDQEFLRDIVWPMIKDHCLIHDDNYPLFGAKNHITKRPEGTDEHMGYGHRIISKVCNLDITISAQGEVRRVTFPDGWNLSLKNELKTRLYNSGFDKSYVDQIIEQVHTHAKTQNVEFSQGYKFESKRALAEYQKDREI